MVVFARACRCVLGLVVGFFFGNLLSNIDVDYFVPAGWSFQQSQLLEGLLLCVVGVLFGALIATTLSIGEPLPAWPIGVYMLGVVGFAWTARAVIQPIPSGDPSMVDWVWLALISLGPAMGAGIVLVLLLRRSSRGLANAVVGGPSDGPAAVE